MLTNTAEYHRSMSLLPPQPVSLQTTARSDDASRQRRRQSPQQHMQQRRRLQRGGRGHARWNLALLVCALATSMGRAQDNLPPYFASSTTAPVSKAPVVVPSPTAAPVATTEDPTMAPVESPVTKAPVSTAPVSSAPVSKAPVSSAPVSKAPVSSEPTSSAPTSAPTLAPVTGSPSTGPSSAPSLRPTMSPTAQPTAQPTSSPTDRPSTQPSVSLEPTSVTPPPTISREPTEFPTVSPTRQPTQTPSVAPTGRPTVANSLVAPTTETTTTAPVAVATTTPTLPLQTQLVNVVLRMTVVPGKLENKSATDFEDVTAAHIATQTGRLQTPVPVKLRTVDVDIYGQTTPNVATTSTSTRVRPSGLRSLQTNNSDDLVLLRIGFNVLVEYQSTKTDYDVAEWIGSAFNSEQKRNTYMDRLMMTNTEFADLEKIEILVDGVIPTEVAPVQGQTEPDDGEDRTLLWIIVAAVGGGTVALAGLAMLLCNRAGGKKDSKEDPNSGTTSTDDYNAKLTFSAEIDVQRQDDISTLGDPVFGHAMHLGQHANTDSDQRTASVGADYDFHKGQVQQQTSFLGATRDRFQSEDTSESAKNSMSTFSKTTSLGGPVGHAVFADDESFEEVFASAPTANKGTPKFSILVPPGKLGMVIDTPHGGAPIVHAIKSESVLGDRVVVGDYLVRVDETDVTSMTAVDVSKLISLKSDSPRKLVFVRGRQNSFAT